jgi:hypothetical protein
MYRLAPVIGSDEKVRIGSKEELLYWRVIPRHIGNVGKDKQFYISPNLAPGYDRWSKLPEWQEKIQRWEEQRKKVLLELTDEDFIVIK